MNQLFRQNLVEALIGAGVLLIAVVAALVFYQRTSAKVGEDMYEIAALFENAAGIAVGTDVRVSGITVGRVVGQTLESDFPFRARLQLAIDNRYRLPADSSASITSEGILGGNYIALTPGGDTEKLQDGDEIIDTQGSVDMLGLIGSYINNSGNDMSGGGTAGSGQGASGTSGQGFGNLEDDPDTLGIGVEAEPGTDDDSL